MSYLMWDITNVIYADKTSLLCPIEIMRSNRQTPLTGLSKSLNRGQKSTFIPFVTTCTKSYKYCPL